MTLLLIAVYLFCAHFVCDFSLQSDFIAKGKNRANSPLNGVHWFWIMLAHCSTHALAVAIITQSPLLALFELAMHFEIDCLTCEKVINHNTDQTLHLLCKAVWFGLFCWLM